MNIKQLPQDVISKIAAGEVIERPVFAVKELVENSLDAGATSIIIHIEESGLKKINVIDNGEGMNEEDLRACFKPHTTSKLADIEALQRISTLGFRGEALASIAAISRMTILSRVNADASGNKINLKDGRIEKITPVGMPVGTNIVVNYLFHNLPVRKKFLKSPRTEFRQIIDLITKVALAYPKVHFTLTHNNKTIFDLPVVESIEARLEKLLSKDIFSALIPANFKDTYFSYQGFLAKPPMTTRTPNKQYLYINNRHITDKHLSHAIKSAYGTMLASNTYPICVMFLTMPYDHVDVNVHPRKEEVKLINLQSIQTTITESIKNTFAGTYENVSTDKSTHSYAANLLKEKKYPWELQRNEKPDTGKIMQLHNLYLMSPSHDGLLLYDQHAVHERILYETFLREFQQEKKKLHQHQFNKPQIIEVSYSERELLLEYLPLLTKVGWEIEQFKDTSFIISAVPDLFQDRNITELLREIIEDFHTIGKPKELDASSHKMIAYLACRGAVKAGDKLTKQQAIELLEQLEKVPNNATCPHGRPTKVSLDRDKLNSMFKRK